MVIQHNMQAMFINRNIKFNIRNNSKTTEHLSSGYRINRSADDAAGLSISEKMRWYIRGLNRDVRNIQDGISLIQVADGALSEVHSMLHRMNELSVQAANDTNTDIDRNMIQQEIDQIKRDINRISTDTAFNDDIVIFKPTNVPQIKGRPTDILVYHEDYNGDVREGGLIYNGRRYKYISDSDPSSNSDFNFAVKLDSSGNIEKGEYSLKAIAEDNKEIYIKFVFDGGNRTPSARRYELDPQDDGIYIDHILHPWSTIKDKNGNSLDPQNLQSGTYSFVHAGMTITFDVSNGLDFLSLLEELRADGLDTYSLESGDVSSDSPKVNPSIGMTDVNVTKANQNYIPGNTSTNSETYGYRMHADENEVYMYLDSSDSNGQGRIELDHMTWEQLRLNEWFRGNNGTTNPSSTVTGGEAYSGYTYRDSKTGSTISFAVDSEVSKGELIKAINNWRIDVTTNNQMLFTANSSGSGTSISIGSHSGSLDAYGTQYRMGRDMSSQLVLQSGMVFDYDSAGDKLSFTMEDAKNKVYTFSAGNIKSQVDSGVSSDLQTYMSNYRTAYQNYLNYTQGNKNFTYSGSSNYDNDICFNDVDNGYYVNVNYTNSFNGWLTNNDFNVTEREVPTGNPYNPTRKEYTVSLKSGVNNTLKNKKNTLVNNIYNALKKTTITAKTDNNNITATTAISSTTPTRNTRYSSQTITGDREVKIQVGPLSGQYVKINLPAMNTSVLKVGGIDVTTTEGANSAITSVQKGIDIVSNMRSQYGATQNRLEHAKMVDQINAENTQAAESSLRDADMAKEMVDFSRNNIILQIEQSIFAQNSDYSRNMLLDLLQ